MCLTVALNCCSILTQTPVKIQPREVTMLHINGRIYHLRGLLELFKCLIMYKQLSIVRNSVQETFTVWRVYKCVSLTMITNVCVCACRGPHIISWVNHHTRRQEPPIKTTSAPCSRRRKPVKATFFIARWYWLGESWAARFQVVKTLATNRWGNVNPLVPCKEL